MNDVVPIPTTRVYSPSDLLQRADSYLPLHQPTTAPRNTRVWNLHADSEDFERVPLPPAQTAELGVHAVRNLQVFGAHYIGRQQRHAHVENVHAPYVVNYIKSGRFKDAKPLFGKLSRRVIADPAFVINSRQSRIYGHFLLEMLPKLALVKQLTEEMALVPRIVLEKSDPEYVPQMIRTYLPHCEFIYYDKTEEYLVVKTALLPTALFRNFILHSQMGVFFRELRHLIFSSQAPTAETRETVSRHNRFFVSRAVHRQNKGWDSRIMTNEDELRDLARAREFHIFEPQLLPMADQLLIFDNASIISRKFSSALHNSIFAESDLAIIAFDRMNNVQERIAQLTGQALIQILPEDRLKSPV